MLLSLSRLFPILLFAAVIVGYVRLIRINQRMWPAAAWVIVLSVHWILFYAAVLITNAQPNVYTNIWLNGLAVHTGGTLVYAAFVMYRVFSRHAN